MRWPALWSVHVQIIEEEQPRARRFATRQDGVNRDGPLALPDLTDILKPESGDDLGCPSAHVSDRDLVQDIRAHEPCAAGKVGRFSMLAHNDLSTSPDQFRHDAFANGSVPKNDKSVTHRDRNSPGHASTARGNVTNDHMSLFAPVVFALWWPCQVDELPNPSRMCARRYSMFIVTPNPGRSVRWRRPPELSSGVSMNSSYL